MSELRSVLVEVLSAEDELDPSLPLFEALLAATESALSGPTVGDMVAQAFAVLVRAGPADARVIHLVTRSMSACDGSHPPSPWEIHATSDLWSGVFKMLALSKAEQLIASRRTDPSVLLGLMDASGERRELRALAVAAFCDAVGRGVFDDAVFALKAWTSLTAESPSDPNVMAASAGVRARLATSRDATRRRLVEVVATHGLAEEQATAFLRSLKADAELAKKLREAMPALFEKLGEVAPDALGAHLVATAPAAEKWKATAPILFMAGWPQVTPQLTLRPVASIRRV